MSDRKQILILADHASNFIPTNKNNLGLNKKQINSHIAYDLGVKQLAETLSKQLNCYCILGKYSRLMIDLNRDTNDPTLISAISDKVIIPGNCKISTSDKRIRLNEAYNYYHDEIKNLIRQKEIKFLISLHSFNPIFKAKKRIIKFGVLSNNDRRLSEIVINQFKEKNCAVGDNKPYEGNLIGDTMYKHGLKNNIPHTLIEVRNDLLSTPKKIKDIAGLICKIIRSSEKPLQKYL